MLNDSVTKLHEKHKKEIESLVKNDSKSMVRLSTNKAKNSINPQIVDIGSNLIKLKSPLSVKDNPDSLTKIDQILAMILKLHNEISLEKNHKIITEKGLMILGLLNSLKLLSIVTDNHQPILEMVKYQYNNKGITEIFGENCRRKNKI